MATACTSCIDGGDIKLLTRTGLDWSHRYDAPSKPCLRSQGSLPISAASCAHSQQKTRDRRSVGLFRISDALSSER